MHSLLLGITAFNLETLFRDIDLDRYTTINCLIGLGGMQCDTCLSNNWLEVFCSFYTIMAFVPVLGFFFEFTVSSYIHQKVYVHHSIEC